VHVLGSLTSLFEKMLANTAHCVTFDHVLSAGGLTG